MAMEKTVLAVTQLYEVTSDESRIDKYADDEQQCERMHRMFRNIMGNPTTRQTIMEFIVLEKHWIESGEVFDYLGEQFGHDAFLFDALLQLKDIFAPADQAWLQELDQETKRRAEARVSEENEEDNDEGAFFSGNEDVLERQKKSWRNEWLKHDIFPLLLALGGNDFEFTQQEAEPSGWMVQVVRPHTHDRAD